MMDIEKFFRDALDWDGCYTAKGEEMSTALAAEIDALTRERDEARAEVERLRPAAEAWEVLQAAYQGHGSSLEYAYSVACVKRAGILRARAAKVKA